MRILLVLLMLSSLCSAKYNQVGDTVQVYGIRNYPAIALEGFMGSGALLLGCANGAGHLGVSGLAILGGAVAIGDAIRRAFESSDVMTEISPEGLLYKDVDLVPWSDINRIDCVSITAVRNGHPLICGYQLYLNTQKSTPVAIEGAGISESMHSLLGFIRKYYTGEIKMKTMVVQDTPRVNYVYNLNNNKQQ